MPWEACDRASSYPEAVGVPITPAEGPLGDSCSSGYSCLPLLPKTKSLKNLASCSLAAPLSSSAGSVAQHQPFYTHTHVHTPWESSMAQGTASQKPWVWVKDLSATFLALLSLSLLVGHTRHNCKVYLTALSRTPNVLDPVNKCSLFSCTL